MTDGATPPAPSSHPPEHMDFGPLRIRFDHGVIRPRPWTLGQSQWAAEAAGDLPEGPVLELCAGAGQIGLAVAALTRRRLVQVDASPAACALASINAMAAGLAHRVEVRQATVAEALGADERFPLILADPPYIPTTQAAGYDDPRHAIDGGEDGLELLRQCCAVAACHLGSGGLVSVQVWGSAQAAALAACLPDSLVVDEVRPFGPDRAVVHLLRP